MSDRTSKRSATYSEIDRDPEYVVNNIQPMRLDETLLMPSQAYQSFTTTPPGCAFPFVGLALSSGRIGLYNLVTPAGAREIAAALIRCAERAEAELAGLAAGELDRIRAARR